MLFTQRVEAGGLLKKTSPRERVGGSLARVAMQAFVKTATEIAKEGKFTGFAGLMTNQELNKFFSEDREKLSS